MTDWWWVFAAVPPGGIIGYSIGSWQNRRDHPTDEQLARYMGRIVNMEEIEENQRLTKFRMARNGRKTQRFDGGPNAKIMRVKVRPVAKRFRGQK